MKSAKDYPYDRTDLGAWRLVVSEDSHGQHKWVYLDKGDPRRDTWAQSQPAKYWLDLDLVSQSTQGPFDHPQRMVSRLQLKHLSTCSYIGSSRTTGSEDPYGSR
jgi:hypothetical protein